MNAVGYHAYHGTRFGPDRKRDAVWAALWRHYFRHQVPADACVLDLGCGYGSFINQVQGARRRIAVDAWPGFPAYLDHGVEPVVGSVLALDPLADGEVDYALASNLVEHLTRADFARMLEGLRPKLSPRGTLTLLQPNYQYAYRTYWDDYTHLTPWSHVGLADFLAAEGWQVLEVRPRFLPLTVKSRLPASHWLVAAYLASPWKPLGAQMLLRAQPVR